MLKQPPISRFIDGGYLSYCYGLFNMSAWTSSRINYAKSSGVCILMDSDESCRKEYYPLYKSHRVDQHPEKKERVKRFQAYLREDPSLMTLEARGLEADDLIAIFYNRTHCKITGGDKDLLQLHGIQLEHIDGEPVRISDYARRLPKAIWNNIQSAEQVLFSLCLMGDHSDDIPRLIPPRRLDLMNQLLACDSPWEAARDLFKEDLLRNLYLAFLPGPWCWDPQPTEEDIFSWITGHTVATILRSDLQILIKELEMHNGTRR